MIPRRKLVAAVATASVLWILVFRLELGSFWLRLTLSAIVLAAIALILRRGLADDLTRISLRVVFLGVLVGLGMYALLFMGFRLAEPYVRDDASSVYKLREQAPHMLIAFILFVVAACEEVFWRGLVQDGLRGSVGLLGSVLATSLLYSSIHISSFNVPLMLAALVAGALWGLQYAATRSLPSVIISHIVWDELVFVFLPLPV